IEPLGQLPVMEAGVVGVIKRNHGSVDAVPGRRQEGAQLSARLLAHGVEAGLAAAPGGFFRCFRRRLCRVSGRGARGGLRWAGRRAGRANASTSGAAEPGALAAGLVAPGPSAGPLPVVCLCPCACMALSNTTYRDTRASRRLKPACAQSSVAIIRILYTSRR